MSTAMRILLLVPLLTVVPVGASAIGCGASAPPGEVPAEPPLHGDSPRACTEMGCIDGLAIDFEPSSGWTPGAYELAITLDGQLTTCTGVLPLSSCDAPSFQCTSDAVQVGESGCALDAPAHGLSGLQIDRSSQPKQVDIAISRDGSEITRASFSPTYRRVQPNGDGCPPICHQSVQRLAIP